jgi:two-component system cell cycle sensor histidine kinase/response regulator CckA
LSGLRSPALSRNFSGNAKAIGTSSNGRHRPALIIFVPLFSCGRFGVKPDPLRILLIEDNPADAELITYELKRAELAHESHTVATKKAFLAELRKSPPDAIISDFSMPQFNALDALHALKAHRVEVPFILVTGSQSEEVAVECIKEGADDYILKSSLKRLPTALLASVQRKRAEREREEAEVRVREQAALLNKARDAIMVMDTNGGITFWNAGAERIYGWGAEEVLQGMNAASFWKFDEQKHQDALRQTIQREEWHGELTQSTKDGRTIFVESRWSLIRDSENKPKSILIINTDITERKKLEAQFFRAQRLESIGTLAGGIAHDLNNVLTPILVSLKLLREMKGETPAEVLDTLEASAHRGASIVQQVLSFARGVEGEKAVLQVKHPLNEVLKIAKDIFPRTIEIRSQLEQNLWPVSGDATQLHQVFMNLVVNARDAMPNGGRITIEAKNTQIDENYARMQPEAKAGPYVVISVTDTGTGIPPAVLPKIFEPFFTTKDIGKGTGLGLSTAAGIVRSHSGFLAVYSEPGQGSSFKVYLPAAESRTEMQPEPRGATALPQGRGEVVMVVDDEAAIREIIKVTLENNGYKVITANDGTEAVALFATQKKKVHAAMVDLMMPFMDGIATIRALQKMQPTTKIIGISGLMDQARIGQLNEIGGVSFLAKPFTTEQILAMLSKVLVPG